MIALAALFLAQAAAAQPLPMPPADWSSLPELPVVPPASFDPTGYVRREVAASRCRPASVGRAVEVESAVAVLIDAGGSVQRVVPHAINCPTVEQYTAGYVSSLARRASGLRPGWYRYTMTYRWQG